MEKTVEQRPKNLCKYFKDAFLYDGHKKKFSLQCLTGILSPQYSAVVLFRLSQYYYWGRLRKLGVYIKRFNIFLNGFSASCVADVERGFTVHDPRLVTIGGDSEVGKSAHIYKNTSLVEKNGKYPKLGDNVTLYSGSIVIGGVTLGDNVIVGPNSVVIKNVENNTVVSGIPAITIKKRMQDAGKAN